VSSTFYPRGTDLRPTETFPVVQRAGLPGITSHNVEPTARSPGRGGGDPDRVELERDLALTSVDDPDVSVLYKWRGSVVAHSNAEIAKGSKQWTKDYPLSLERIEKLIARAYEIFNRYCVLFNATSYSKLLIGEDDYENLFKLLRLGLQQFQNGIG